ncbi:MAG: hypothetical protein M4579_004976 [Chaenotheca gracillima]|nr:MAG: hypothetical protein M4579_004976 [Chaenotheca gracillima]
MSAFRSIERVALFLLVSLVFILYHRSERSVEPKGLTGAAKVEGCVPHVPSSLLSEEACLSHPAVEEALSTLDSRLKDLLSGSRDALSLAVVHGSVGEVFGFHHGLTRLNESAGNTATPSAAGGRPIDGDSIFRIASVTKTFVVLEEMILSEQSRQQDRIPRLTLETPLKDVLPDFGLPKAFAEEERRITLGMLGSHRAGLVRDLILSTIKDIRNITFPPKLGGEINLGLNDLSGSSQHILKFPASSGDLPMKGIFQGSSGGSEDVSPERTEKEYLEDLKNTGLIFKAGEMTSYSNTGFNLLGFALEAYNRNLTGKSASFRDLVTTDITNPLKMGHTFFGPIPDELLEFVTVPGVDNFVDYDEGPTEDPAGGMFSSSKDLTKFLHQVLLSPEPLLINAPQREVWLRPSYILPDGKTSIGIPWEITTLKDVPNAPTYQIYAKGGMLPGHYSSISTIPELGYGVVALIALGCSQAELEKGDCNETKVADVQRISHEILAPAFLKAYQDTMIERYAGAWTSNSSTTDSSSARDTAVIEFHDGYLWLKKLETADGTDLLLSMDILLWLAVGKKPRLFDQGAKMWPTGFEGVFRSTVPAGCSWGLFDLFHSNSGAGVDKLTFEKDPGTGELELVHEMSGIRLRKSKESED